VRSLERRLENLERLVEGRMEARVREALGRLSDEELEALDESLPAEAWARGEQPQPNQLLEKMKRWEAEAIERQRAYADASRKRGREFLKRNRALLGLPPLQEE
jgi:hypothetical protein